MDGLRSHPGGHRETHISTEQTPQGATSWIQTPHVGPRRSSRSEGSAAKGPSAAERLIHSCRSRADFQRLRRNGVRRSGSRLWIRYVEDPRCSPPRVAFALGRSAGSAPERNRVRRQLRALLRDRDIVVRPGLYLLGHEGPARDTTFAMLRSELTVLLP